MEDLRPPAGEAARLEALRALRILDTGPEEGFERIVRLAVQLFDVPIAAVSLVDEHREWFKARCGIRETEGDRRVAFCAHAIRDRSPLVVEDASVDPRFHDSPQVLEGGIRFYAGAPLRTRDGQNVGALCIKDRRPRRLSEREISVLELLAEMVVQEMEHRLLEASQRVWEHIFGHAEWGIAVAHGDRRTLDLVNPAFARMHGFRADELAGRPIVDVFAPDCRDDVAARAERVATEGRHVYESMHVRKDGSTFPVEIDATAVKDDQGRLLYRAAHVLDISGRRRAEEELRLRNAILSTQQEVSPDGILVVDGDGKFLSYNRRFAEMWGIPERILATGRDDLALEHATRKLADPEAFLARVRYLYAHPEEASFDPVALRDGRAFERYSAPMVGGDGRNYGRVWFFRDITERSKSEQALRESEERLERVLESAMDAIIAVDRQGRVELFNQAAEDVFRCRASEAVGRPLFRLLSPPFQSLLRRCIRNLGRSDSRKRYMWVPEGLAAVRADGEEFPVEASISQVRSTGDGLYVLILRDVNDRLRAEEDLQRLRLENVSLREEMGSDFRFEEIVYAGKPLRRVLDDVESVAPTDATVLITGETGTGKELIARAVHNRSGRREAMLHTVNCAGLPGALIESELFGHEKGAFTGALCRRVGRFERAHGSTILLDEIGDLPLDLQTKLLRVLQEGELERVGGTETIAVDVRMIAATHRDLAEEVEQGRFRADLFYRLHVFPIHIPPLRERPEDVAPLVRHFVVHYASRMGKRIEEIPRRTLEALVDYAWPGNVRELQNVVERGMILSRGPALDLGGWLPTRPTAEEAPGGVLTLAELDRRHILEVLESTGWRVSGRGGAAELLGLKRTTLEARMKKLGIVRPGA